MNIQETYLQRCIDLAQLGAGSVAPNPMVGAVLVHNGHIIGEGYHEKYGEGHAEVNCLKSVSEADRPLIKESVLYVSLEPCAHYGKTPPCSKLIIDHQIPKVVIGCSDPFAAVNGRGIEQLEEAGIEVVCGVLQKAAEDLNKRFFVFHQHKRPYIILKWAETGNGKIASLSNERLLISNDFSNRLVHQWRSEEAGILVGTQTALKDNPSLTNRLWTGKNPVRMVIDKDLRLPDNLHLFNRQIPTMVFNNHRQSSEPNLQYCQLDFEEGILPQLLAVCYAANIQSILVEGGSRLLQSFIDEGIWDEARVIRNEGLLVAEGLAAPELKQQQLVQTRQLLSDTIFYYQKVCQAD